MNRPEVIKSSAIVATATANAPSSSRHRRKRKRSRSRSKSRSTLRNQIDYLKKQLKIEEKEEDKEIIGKSKLEIVTSLTFVSFNL